MLTPNCINEGVCFVKNVRILPMVSGNCILCLWLIQDYCGSGLSNGSFRIITENVPCGTTGTSCSKTIKIFLGVDTTHLHRSHLLPQTPNLISLYNAFHKLAILKWFIKGGNKQNTLNCTFHGKVKSKTNIHPMVMLLCLCIVCRLRINKLWCQWLLTVVINIWIPENRAFNNTSPSLTL